MGYVIDAFVRGSLGSGFPLIPDGLIVLTGLAFPVRDVPGVRTRFHPPSPTGFERTNRLGELGGEASGADHRTRGRRCLVRIDRIEAVVPARLVSSPALPM
jgi:hypothetical protein